MRLIGLWGVGISLLGSVPSISASGRVRVLAGLGLTAEDCKHALCDINTHEWYLCKQNISLSLSLSVFSGLFVYTFINIVSHKRA